MRYFKLGSLLAMVALSFSLAQPAQAYIFGFSNGKQPIILTLNGVPVTNKDGESIEDSGWYRDVVSPIHYSGYQNYIVAQPGDVDAAEYRNFFVFNIEGLSSQVLDDSTASLTLYSYDVTSTATYTLYDVTTDIHTLINGTTPPVPPVFPSGAFTDLGTGTVPGEIYGSRLYKSDEDDNDSHTIALNSKFIVDLNAAIRDGQKRIAIGGAMTLDSPDRGLPGRAGNPSNVPEPSTLLLLGLALVGLAAWRRKHAA